MTPTPSRHLTHLTHLVRRLGLLLGLFLPAVFTLFTLELLAHPAHADDLGETTEILWSLPDEPDLLARATALATPVAIYEFVRNELEFTLYHGARSSSVNSFLGRIGNDVDTASTLIAMLRSQGIRARYAVATVRAPAADVTSWLGVRDVELAASILDDQGIQNVALSTGNAHVEFEHVWVQAFLPLDRYRAAGPAAQIDCVAAPNACTWVDLAPAFKRRAQKDPAELIDVRGIVDFDFEALYHALDPSFPTPADGIDRADKGPLEIYEEQILAHLHENFPGKTLEDVADDGGIVPERRGLIPESLPFALVSPVLSFDSVAEHDAAAPSMGTKRWEKRIQLTLVFDGFPLGFGSASLSELSTQRLTLAIQTTPTGTEAEMLLRLGGNARISISASGSLVIGGVPVVIGTPFDLRLRLDGPPATTDTDTDVVIERTYPNLVVGGYYAISTGGETSNFSQVHRAARQLLAAADEFPIVLDSTQVPHVDRNGDGVFTAGSDTPLLTDLEAQDALTGGLLFTAQELYFARLREARDRLEALDHVVSPIAGFLGVVSSVHEVEYLEETAFAITPGGLLIDMKGIQFNGNWRNDQPAETAPDHFELFGHTGSSLEHEVWQEITGFDAISTVRGIQFALRDGATVVDARKNLREDTLPDQYDELGFSIGAPPSPWVRQDFSLFGTQPTTWFPNPDPGPLEMEMIQARVDLTTPPLRLSRLSWSSENFVRENIQSVDNIENQFLASPNAPFQLTCGGQPTQFGTGAQLLPVLEGCWDDIRADLGGFFDFIDRAQGFVPEDHVYRADPSPVNFHDVPFIRDIRNDLYLRDFASQWVEYVLPSRRPQGPFFLFSVDLRKQFVEETGALISQSFSIRNLSGLIAGGGFVSGEEVIELTNSNVFNNEVLTDVNLIRLTNNDVIKTPSTADPVSTVTGNMFLDETDLVIKGRGLDLVFTRTYNSGSVKNAGEGLPLSPGWTHSYAMRLRSNDYGRLPDAPPAESPENANGKTSSISYTDERGGEINYLVDDLGGSPSFAVSAPTGVFDQLTLDAPSPGLATLRFRNGVEYIFYAQGGNLRTPGVIARLAQIRDPFGNRIDLTYDASGRLISIDDGVNVPGRTGLTLDYTPEGRLAQIEDWTGRSWRYGYNFEGNLSSFTNPRGDSTRYRYVPEPGLASALLAGAFALAGAARRRARRRRGMGADTERANGSLGRPIAVSSRRRLRLSTPLVTVLTGLSVLGALVAVAISAPPARAAGPMLLSEVVKPADRDGDGQGDVRTEFAYYRNAKTFSNRNALGVGETLDYDLFRKRTRVEDPRGFIQRHFYDRNGQLVKREERDGGIQFFSSTPDLLRFQKADALGFVTSFSYLQNDLADGQLDGGPSDTFGNVVLERDPLGATVEMDYDFALYDQPTRVKDKNGAVRLMSYYPADDTAVGAKRGKLFEVRLEQLGDATNVLLRRFTYNPNGTVRTRVDFLEAGNPNRARTTTFSYMKDGLDLTQIVETGSDGTTRRRTFVYDGLGRKISETLWRRTSPTNPILLPLTRQFEYDALDRVTLERDPLGNEALTFYDDNGQVFLRRMRYKQPGGGFVTRTLEQREFDAADRLVLSRDILGGETRMEYDEAGNPTRITDPTGASLGMEYDAVGRRTALSDENGHRSQTVYDLAGRVVAEIDPNGHATTYTYDPLGRMLSRTDPLGHTTTFAYDPNGNQTAVTTPRAQLDPTLRNTAGVSQLREVDELGRVVRIVDAEDGETRFEYDLLGNRTKVTDALSQVTEFVYDDLGRLVEIIDPVVESPDRRQTFVVDEADNVIVSTDREGQTTQRFFDPLNRLTERRFLASGESETIAYDPFGNVESQSNDEVTYTFTYDDKDRLLSKTDSRFGRSLEFEYDAADRVIRKTDFEGDETFFLYDGTGRLVAEQSPTSVQVSYHYDAAGNLLNRILSNGAQTDFTYDAANRLTSITNRSADGTIVHQVAHTRDPDGNLIASTGTDGPTSYDYDALNRLTVADLPGTADDRSYQYDAVGNRRVETIGSETRHYAYDPGHRLRDVRLGNPFGPLLFRFLHDANGAITEKQDATGETVWRLDRNDRGQVTRLNGPGFFENFGYDPRSLRVRRNGSQGSFRFHLDGDGLESVYDATGELRADYLRGAVIDEVVHGFLEEDGETEGSGPLVPVTFHHDQVTSVVGLSGHTGTVEQRRVYAPFGEVLSETGAGAGGGTASGTLSNELAYTGRERDAATGLYYVRARWYDPEIGRFLSEDPLGFGGGSFNLYAYVGNNPLGFNDPTGRIGPLVTGLIGAGGSVAGTCFDGCTLVEGLTAAGAGFFVGSGLALLTAPLSTSLLLTGGAAAAAETLITGGTGALLGNAIEQGVDIASNPEFTFGNDFSFTESGIAFGSGILGATPAALSTFGTATALATAGRSTGSLLAQGLEVSVTEQIAFEAFSTGVSIGIGQLVGDVGNSGSTTLPNSGGAGGLGPAAGGFLLFPSKPNLNQAETVYRKP